jgi:hypothetical protein
LRSQAAAACDFVTVDTVRRRFYLLFFIDIATRHVTFAGMTTNPTGPWTAQAARNLFIVASDTFAGCKMLVRDRAGQQPPDRPIVTPFHSGARVTTRTRCDSLIHEYQQAA